MAKVARASISAVQSAAESQQLLPALQQLLATCSIASRTANAAECDVSSTHLQDPPTSSSSLDDAADAASCSYSYQDHAARGLQHHNNRHWHRGLSTHSAPRSAVCTSVADGSAGSEGIGTPGGPKQPSSTSATTTSSSSGSQSGAKAQADPLTLALDVLRANSYSNRLTPSIIVQQLDKHIVGQPDAKRAVAVALRNRWRRHMLPADLAEEITPKNILMIGPTGCGKTEIARRLAQLVSSPFIKVEATKFTELGFVGRDVDEIVKDLMEASLSLTRTRLGEALREVAERAAEDVILAALTGADTEDMKGRFRDLYRKGQLEESRVELDLDSLGLNEQGGGGGLGTHGNPLQAFAAMMEAMAGRAGSRGGGGRQQGKASMTVAEARKLLTDGEIERSLQSERVVAEALRAAQQDGIVFIDEIDKIVETTRGVSGATSSNVSSEGVQRDLLPILEGSKVPTKYGNVSTDHVLFIASGAFHSSKPSDMLAELQGRLPVRVELKGLTADDFYRILTEPKHNMIKQQQVLLATEGIDLAFTDGAVRAIAEAAHQANLLLDNIGARRLHTVVERVLADISFSAPEKVAAAAEQQQQQEASQQAAGGAAGTSSSPSSSKGAKSKASAAGSGSQGGKSRGKGSKDSASSSKKGLVRYEVTEDMVQECMKEVLKQKDLSRYML